MGETGHADGIELSTAERAAIDATFATLETVTLYELLGVGRFASTTEVDAAFELIAWRFSRAASRRESLGPWRAKLETIQSRITHAHEVLGNPIRRVGYDAVLEPPEAVTLGDSARGAVIETAEPRVVTEEGLFDSLFPAELVCLEPEKPAAAADRATAGAVRESPRSVGTSPRRPTEPSAALLARPSTPRPPSGRPASRALIRPAATRSMDSSRGVHARTEPEKAAAATPGRSPLRRTGLDVMEGFLKDARARKVTEPSRGTDSTGAQRLPGKTPIQAIARPTASVPSAGDSADPPVTAIDNVRKLVAEAGELEQSHRWVEASAIWASAFRVLPGEGKLRLRASNAMAHAALAAIRTGNSLPKALAHAREAVAIAADNVNAHTTLAKVFLMGGLKTSARIALQKALALDPESQNAKALQSEMQGH